MAQDKQSNMSVKEAGRKGGQRLSQLVEKGKRQEG